MSAKYTEIIPPLQDFITKQKIFFVATAAAEGTINLSPKGLDSLKVINSKKLIWLNLTGSGNETAAHLLKDPRMTIMMNAFEGAPLILRLYGKAKAHHEGDEQFDAFNHHFQDNVGTRQIIEMDIDLVQTSCGFGVPILEFKEERTQLDTWANKLGKEGIIEYQQKKNKLSIDGFDTGLKD